jgi:hypothetical protein
VFRGRKNGPEASRNVMTSKAPTERVSTKVPVLPAVLSTMSSPDQVVAALAALATPRHGRHQPEGSGMPSV